MEGKWIKPFQVLKESGIRDGLCSIAASAVGTFNPVAGVVVTAFKECASIADEARLNYIIHGLATGLNMETFTNELWNYVSQDENKAFHAANAIRKSLLMDSPIACALMGRILADHVALNNSYDRDDSIIIHALETATDEDLICFRKMMNTIRDGKVEVLDQTTVDWCEMSRLFKKQTVNPGTWESISFIPEYKPETSAFRMAEYLDKIKQIFRSRL